MLAWSFSKRDRDPVLVGLKGILLSKRDKNTVLVGLEGILLSKCRPVLAFYKLLLTEP